MQPTMEEVAVTRLLLVRHGESTWNRESREQGQSDPELTDLGRRQAERLGMRLASEPIAAAYASDLQRAYDTAQIAVAGRGITIVREPSLREVHRGVWEGLTFDEVEKRYPGMRDWLYADPGSRAIPAGETMREVQSRACAAIDRIVAAHPDETVFVATHGGTLKSMLCYWLNLPLTDYRSLPSANCCLYVVAASAPSGRVIGDSPRKESCRDAATEGKEAIAGLLDPRGASVSATDYRMVVHHDIEHCAGLEVRHDLTETADR